MMNPASLRRLAGGLLLAAFASQVAAHGGEEHDHAEPAAAAAPPAGDASRPQRLADNSLWIAKPTQRRLGLRTRIARLENLAETLTFNGQVIADPNASGRVQAMQAGRIEAGPKGLPMLGQRVAKGEVLAWLKPAASSLERGNQQALLAELNAQTGIAERRVQRLNQLEGALPQKDIDTARDELAALQQRRSAIGASLATSEALRAPVSGVISASHVALGQVVDAREVLFEVVDPARLAVEALAYEGVPAGLAEASAHLAGGSGSLNLSLQFIGAGRQLRQQALPLLFRIKAGSAAETGRLAASLAIGQPVSVVAQTTDRSQGFALPRSALSKNTAGDSVVWLHIGAERFVPRVVVSTPLTGDRIAIRSGIQAGDRVVSVGASLLAQIR
jgi:hypothetical protein